MKLFIAIIWTLALFTNGLGYLTGSEPTWLLVFYPLICMTLTAWGNYVEDL